MIRLLLSLFGAFATIALIWFTDIPLGVPGEWTWQRRAVATDFGWSLVPACVWITLLGCYVWLGSGQFDESRRPSRWRRMGWLAGLVALSFVTMSGLREAAPMECRSAKIAFVLYFPGSSGYFTEARKVSDTRQFLATYSETVSQGDVLHQGTHPPGLIVGYRALMWVCQVKWVRDLLLTTLPQDLREAFRIISDQSRGSGGAALTDHDRSVLWLAALLMQMCAAATILPLYALLRCHGSRSMSWQMVSFWPLVPAVTLFLPKSDVCFPFLGCTVLALWLYGLKLRSSLLCVAAGATFWVGMTLSLALLPVGCMAGMLTAWHLWGVARSSQGPNLVTRFIQAFVAGGCGFLIPTLLLWGTTGCNLFVVWGWNFRNHAGFYEQFSRTYWKWLLVNPLELLFALGLPLAFLALSGVYRAIQKPRGSESGPVWASLSTWGLLWLSGKNMGEAARLWIFLMPWAIWSGSVGSERTTSPPDSSYDRMSWAIHWACQVIAALATVTRVVGFHL